MPRLFRPPALAALAVLLGIVAAAPVRAAGAFEAGQPLAGALDELRRDGLQLIYSSELVAPTLRVVAPPSAPTAEARARELLAPHGLALESVAPGVYAVVRSAQPAAQAPAPVPARDAPLDDVVVAASRYRLSSAAPEAVLVAAGVELATLPTLGQDALRTGGRLPGVAQSATSAASYVRGGAADETMLLLDGFPIREPFHFACCLSPFSVLDPSLVDTLDLYTGGFPARYGGRLSGVYDVHTLAAPAAPEYALGLGFFDATARGAGPVPGAPALDWLALGRYGTLATLLRAFAPDTGEPHYYDAYARLGGTPAPGVRVTLNALATDDEFVTTDPQRAIQADVESRSSYVWLQARWDAPGGASLEGWLGRTAIDSTRAGELTDPALGRGTLEDSRASRIWDARLRGTLPLARQNRLEGGLEWSAGRARYDYARVRELTPLVAAAFGLPTASTLARALDPERNELRAWASLRTELAPALIGEFGARLLQSGGDGLRTTRRWEPRSVLRWQLAPDTALRIAWGRYRQPDEVTELRVADGDTVYQEAASAEHLVLGVEHRLAPTLRLRAEAFRKREGRPRIRFENLYDTRSLLPELLPDRVALQPTGSELHGVETSLDWSRGTLSGWLTYTWSEAYDEFGARETPRSWDQTHAFGAGLAWRPGPWLASAALELHSGWPTTTLVTDAGGALVPGPRNAMRLGTYGTLDLRVQRRWTWARGTLEASLTVTNASDRENPCCSELSVTHDATGRPQLALRPRNWLPALPSLAVTWTF